MNIPFWDSILLKAKWGQWCGGIWERGVYWDGMYGFEIWARCCIKVLWHWQQDQENLMGSWEQCVEGWDLFWMGTKGTRMKSLVWIRRIIHDWSSLWFWYLIAVKYLHTTICVLCNMSLWLIHPASGAFWVVTSLRLWTVQQDRIWKELWALRNNRVVLWTH